MNTRHLVRAAVPLAVGAVLLAGCSSSGSSGGGSSSGGKTYKIGYQGPLSGGNAALGINMNNGVKLAVVSSDDVGSADGSPPAARKLIGDSSVVAVVGPAFSGASDAAGSLYKSANMLAATPSATLPDLTDHGFTTFYRAVADDNAQGPPDADYLINKVGVKKIFLVDDTTDYGTGLAKAFKDQVEKDGQKLAGSDSAPQTSTCIPGATGSTSQYPSEANKVKNSGADAVYYAGYYCDFALLAKALRNVGFNGQMMSGDGSDDQKYVDQAGNKVADGTLLSCQCSDIASNPKGADFVTAYQKAYGVAPGAYSAEAFDVTNAIISVMKGMTGDITRGSIVDAFGSVDYQGLTKQIKFAPDHNLLVQTAFLYQVKSGAIKYLGDLTQLTK